ncbi:ribosomal protein S7 domain-containing protein, partial [Jimgerdemannia flammicorona]
TIHSEEILESAVPHHQALDQFAHDEGLQQWQKAHRKPIKVIVDAIINTGLYKDSTHIGLAGTVRYQVVDISLLYYVNQAIVLLTISTHESAFHNNKTITEYLADELINTVKSSSNLNTIKKKDELEHITKSNC